MRQGRLAEDALEERQHMRMGPEPVQRLIGPDAAKHRHVALLGVLAGGGGVGDAILHGMFRIEPAAGRRLLQKTQTDLQHGLARQQPAQEQIAVAMEPLGQGRAIADEIGRIEEAPRHVHRRCSCRDRPRGCGKRDDGVKAPPADPRTPCLREPPSGSG